MNNSEYGYPQSTVIIKSELIDNDKEFVSKIMNEIKESCNWIYEDKEKLGV